jgi:hypothetical protein
MIQVFVAAFNPAKPTMLATGYLNLYSRRLFFISTVLFVYQIKRRGRQSLDSRRFTSRTR